ncbi:hypothetical protein [Methylorubrum zatmanii]|nr:hypothetical protein [Methylorubrum zatmanii]
MASRSFKMSGLPQEGTWLIRWIDGFVDHPASLSNPEIEVALERLADDRWDGVTFAEAVARNEPARSSDNRPMESVICRLHAGAITGLHLGAVIHKGDHVGRLDAPIVPFGVDLPGDLLALPPTDQNLGLVHAGTRIGGLIGGDSERALVPRDLYRTFLIPRLVTPVKVSGGVLILPSSVVIRAFISPIGAVVRDLVRRPPQPLPLTPQPLLYSVLGPGTGVMQDGRWRVALDAKIHERHAPLLANLHRTFSEHGFLAAERVFDGARSEPPRLAGPLPFTDCILHMRVHVYEIAPGHWLALDVESARWPYDEPREIDVVRWVREGERPGDVLYRPGGRPGLADDGQIDVLSQEDAHEGADLAMWATGGPAWEALPVRHETREPYHRDEERWVGVKSGNPSEVGSLGGTGPHGDVEAVTFDQGPKKPSQIEPIARFEEILALFDELCAPDPRERRGTITSAIPCVQGLEVDRIMAGNCPVWRFRNSPNKPDKPNPWVVWNPGAMPERSRTALVCRIPVPGHGDATWFEIEGRTANDLYRALIVGRLLCDAEIIAILDAVSEQNNVLHVDYGAILPHCPPPALWKHGRVKETGRLSAKSAWAKLVAAFGG